MGGRQQTNAKNSPPPPAPGTDATGGLHLAVEGGGTRTVALLADARGNIVRRFETGPLNLKLATDREIRAALRSYRQFQIPGRKPAIAAVALCLAGCGSNADRARLRALAAAVFPRARLFLGNDLDSGLAAAFGSQGSGILVISGTGSCVIGRHHARTVRAGGWGHLLGDHGSGYWIALTALRAAIRDYDRTGHTSRGLQTALRQLSLNSPESLIDWIQRAPKNDIAALAPALIDEYPAILTSAADQLAADCATVAKRLRLTAPDVVLSGGVFTHHPTFFQLTARAIRQRLPSARVRRSARESAHGALLLATGSVPLIGTQESSRSRTVGQVCNLPSFAIGTRESRRARNATNQSLSFRACEESLNTGPEESIPRPRDSQARNDTQCSPQKARDGRTLAQVRDFPVSPTEQRNPRTMDLHTRSVAGLLETMLAEETRVVPAVRQARLSIARAIGAVVTAFRRGGRLFYVGAGTSGRLGVLDASECPPTFSTDPSLVQGIIAGGAPALQSAVEGAEDDPAAGAAAIAHRGVRRADVVIGIAASGSTPFVLGALAAANKRGANTFLLCFSPPSRVALRAATLPRSRVLFVPTGPEVITGSTRLKAGTATKIILNAITTIAMVRLGKVISNLMVDVKPTNDKLRARACRIVAALCGCDEATARQRLTAARWNIRQALERND